MAGRGPLPTGNARRRNAPTIPTTNLPISGRKGAAPRPPKSYELGPAGLAWWRWAWKTPQASAWDPSAIYTAARRAQLEDELAALKRVDVDGLAEVLGISDEPERRDALRWLVGSLKSMASGSTTVMREMRELDNRLGLNPKALAEMRWTIVADEKPEAAAAATDPPNVHRMRPRPTAPGAAASG